ncbi:MAG: hypothetical protein WCV62_04095 [Candidatus Peribacteraceae bacterium]|jgi:hypothetical protein
MNYESINAAPEGQYVPRASADSGQMGAEESREYVKAIQFLLSLGQANGESAQRGGANDAGGEWK